jgi:hypothetical protein
MDSGLYTKVFTSTEVIAASLFLILLLPLVFFIASTRSRRRFVRPAGPHRSARPRVRPKPAARDAEGAEEPERPADPRRRASALEDEGPEPDDRS